MVRTLAGQAFRELLTHYVSEGNLQALYRLDEIGSAYREVQLDTGIPARAEYQEILGVRVREEDYIRCAEQAVAEHREQDLPHKRELVDIAMQLRDEGKHLESLICLKVGNAPINVLREMGHECIRLKEYESAFMLYEHPDLLSERLSLARYLLQRPEHWIAYDFHIIEVFSDAGYVAELIQAGDTFRQMGNFTCAVEAYGCAGEASRLQGLIDESKANGEHATAMDALEELIEIAF